MEFVKGESLGTAIQTLEDPLDHLEGQRRLVNARKPGKSSEGFGVRAEVGWEGVPIVGGATNAPFSGKSDLVPPKGSAGEMETRDGMAVGVGLGSPRGF